MQNQSRMTKLQYWLGARVELPQISLFGRRRGVMVFMVLIGVALLGSPHSTASAFVGCTSNVLRVQVSANGTSPADQISLPSRPVKYYLHMTCDGIPQSTTVEALARSCALPGPCTGSFSLSNAFALFKSNSAGIARIDLDPSTMSGRSFLADGIYEAYFRPVNSGWQWGNLTRITVSGAGSPHALDASQYFIHYPGDAYEYTTYNYAADANHLWPNYLTGTTRVQIEGDINWGGIRGRPWRLSRDNIYAWPGAQTIGLQSLYQNYRWIVNAPDEPQLSGYDYSFGAKYYNIASGQNGLRDLNGANFQHGYAYATTISGSQYPSNILTPRSVTVPYIYYTGSNRYLLYGDPGFLPQLFYSGSANHAWKVRVEQVTINLNHAGFVYNGGGIRADYYEGTGVSSPSAIYQNWLLRESWYFARNIGLVEIKAKNFNGYGGMDPAIAKPCADDPDCFADEMETPHVDMKLKNYWLDPQLDVKASVNGVDYSYYITVVRGRDGYHLKAMNSNFSGYLDVTDPNTGSRKFYWLDNGHVYFSPDMLTGLAPGDYLAKFRVWIPNEAFAAESRLPRPELPWSPNWVTVHVQ